MSIVEWKKKYDVGNDKIDRQHRRFIDLINLVDEKQNISKEELMEVFESLRDYAEFHFQEEEEIMDDIDPLIFEYHKKEHNWFIEKLSEIGKQIESEDPDLIDNLSYFLSDWLISHILNMDMNLAKHLVKEEIIELSL